MRKALRDDVHQDPHQDGNTRFWFTLDRGKLGYELQGGPLKRVSKIDDWVRPQLHGGLGAV